MFRFVLVVNGEEFFEFNRNKFGVVLVSKNYTGGFDSFDDFLDGKIFFQVNLRRCLVEVLKVYFSYLNFNSDALF